MHTKTSLTKTFRRVGSVAAIMGVIAILATGSASAADGAGGGGNGGTGFDGYKCDAGTRTNATMTLGMAPDGLLIPCTDPFGAD